jgi:hypothetical protein
MRAAPIQRSADHLLDIGDSERVNATMVGGSLAVVVIDDTPYDTVT